MIKNNLAHIPQIVLLRSDKVFIKLVNTLLKDNKINTKTDGNQLIEGVRDFYPNSYRLDEIELSLSQKELRNSNIGYTFDYKKSNALDYNFSFLKDLFSTFFEYNGSKIFAKEENLEKYLSFITKVSPLHILAYELATKLKKNKISEYDLLALIDNYTPLSLKVDSQKEYAENHLHLKGASYLSFNMLKLFSCKSKKEYFTKDFLQKIPRINEFSYINNHTYSIGQIIEISKLSIDFIYGSFMNNILEEKNEVLLYLENLSKILTSNQSLGLSYSYSIDTISKMNKLFPIFKNSYEDNLAREIVKFYDKGQFSKAQLMENTLFFYLYENTESNHLKYFIKIYFQASNILRSYMVMSQNIGLSHFSEFSGSYLRTVERKTARNIASSIIDSGTNYLNAKLDVKEDANTISTILQDFKNAFESRDKIIKFNFGLSSKKSRERDIKIQTGNLLPRFYKKRMSIKNEAIAFDDFLRNIKFKKIDKFTNALKYTKIKAYKDKENLKNKSFDISSYVVSIDAVGKETHTPPEIFAPYFKYLRHAPKKLKNDIFLGTKKFSHHAKLVITVHAGEDFNHIITGMRRVEESVKFFDMQRNDRLGHVLSLGLFPKVWLNNIKDLVMYKGDYFDDLVWLCKKLKKLSGTSLDITRFIKIYEDRVWKMFSEIYPMCKKNIHINDLYEAWSYRRNCTLTYYKRKRGEVLFDDYSNIVLEKEPSENVQKIFELYQTNNQVRQNYKKVMNIDKKRISKEEVNIWEALQDRMINQLSQKGIIIETNPSSNVFVSSIDSYDQHPIFRFYPPEKKLLGNGKKFNKFNQRSGRIAVTINSDDPAIFVTSLQNEYRTIKSVAKKKYKCSDKEAEDWIKDIREFSVDLFKESYIESN